MNSLGSALLAREATEQTCTETQLRSTDPLLMSVFEKNEVIWLLTLEFFFPAVSFCEVHFINEGCTCPSVALPGPNVAQQLVQVVHCLLVFDLEN